jgi:signal transduction histidine kinase
VLDTVRGRLSVEQRDSLRVLAEQVVEVLELRRQTRWLDLALSELTRSNAILTDFAGRLSHDLKTPLTAVLGFAQMLEKVPTVEQDARAMDYLGRIVRSGNRMHVLIDNLLSFAVVGGRTTVTPVDLRPLVTAVIDDLAPLVRQYDATVTTKDATVMADPVQLHALVQNLVANAVIYGGGTVEVLADPLGTGWTLRVVDHGQGIPSTQQDRLFEPLTRLDRDVDQPGTGIGLATCRRIAQAHGGTIEIGDTPGGGTTVTVSVPA